MSDKKNKAKTCRYIASESLCQLFKQQLPAKQILNKLCKDAKLTDVDRNLAMNLVFGVLRKRDTLNFLISELSSTKLKKLHPFVHQTLAVGLYQIFFLDSIPESAAVNEAVKSCQQAKIPQRLHGFVNGVLRNSIRQKDSLLEKLQSKGKTLPNHPTWLTDKWLRQFNSDSVNKICSVNEQEPALSLRINSLKTNVDEYLELLQKENITAQKGISDDCIILPDFHGKIAQLPGFNDGWFQVQDDAAQLATLLLQPIKNGGKYLDCCAGLGGKTGHIIQLCKPNNASVTAIEPEKRRQNKFKENIERLFEDQSYTLHTTTVQDFAKNNSEQFSGILVDAPCSGTGVIRKQPDIRWNRQKNDFLKNQKLQLEILNSAATMIAPGGVLVYATCSLEPEENDQVISIFLEQNKKFVLSKCSEFLPENSQKYIRQPEIITDIDGDFFAPLPDKYIDGFFAARLVRRS